MRWTLDHIQQCVVNMYRTQQPGCWPKRRDINFYVAYESTRRGASNTINNGLGLKETMRKKQTESSYVQPGI